MAMCSYVSNNNQKKKERKESNATWRVSVSWDTFMFTHKCKNRNVPLSRKQSTAKMTDYLMRLVWSLWKSLVLACCRSIISGLSNINRIIFNLLNHYLIRKHIFIAHNLFSSCVILGPIHTLSSLRETWTLEKSLPFHLLFTWQTTKLCNTANIWHSMVDQIIIFWSPLGWTKLWGKNG